MRIEPKLLAAFAFSIILIIALTAYKLDEALSMLRFNSTCPYLVYRRIAEASLFLWMLSLVTNYVILNKRSVTITYMSIISAIIGAATHYAWLINIAQHGCWANTLVKPEITLLPMLYIVKIGEVGELIFLDIGQLLMIYSIVAAIRIAPHTASRTQRIRGQARRVS